MPLLLSTESDQVGGDGLGEAAIIVSFSLFELHSAYFVSLFTLLEFRMEIMPSLQYC